jgi:hypothetical protein
MGFKSKTAVPDPVELKGERGMEATARLKLSSEKDWKNMALGVTMLTDTSYGPLMRGGMKLTRCTRPREHKLLDGTIAGEDMNL